jgi:ribonucleoside-diphosphate reductase alpha chain
VLDGERLLDHNPHFERLARQRGFYSGELMQQVALQGGVQGLARVPGEVRRLFVTAHDIAPEWHVRMQAAFQRHCDNAVSKTINFPAAATTDDVLQAFWLAHRLGCKGITVYRQGSKQRQVLDPGGAGADRDGPAVDLEFDGGCPSSRCSS